MNGFTQIPHSIWKAGLEIEEREMLMYILDCQNRFKREGKWINLTDEDFINIGFGKCKSRWRKYREGLISKGLVIYRKGGRGRKSGYKVSGKLNEILDVLPTLSEEAKGFIECCGRDWIEILTLMRKRNYYKDDKYGDEANKIICIHAYDCGISDNSDEWREISDFINLITFIGNE